MFTVFFGSIIHILLLALYWYKLGLIVYGIIYVLEMFDILHRHHPIIYKIHNTLFCLYDPLLSPLQRRFSLPIQICILLLYLALEFVSINLMGFAGTMMVHKFMSFVTNPH